MKKKCLVLALSLLLAISAQAQKSKNNLPTTQLCQYTLLQNLVRDARSHERIFELIKSGVSMDDTTITCGGTILQLAIRRGNPSIVNAILIQNPKRANALVPTAGFDIPNAPDRIPAILFAAYYAPSELVFSTFVNNKADVTLKDSLGRSIQWYLDQNPVLRQTKTSDDVSLALQNALLKQARDAEQAQRVAEQKAIQEAEQAQKDKQTDIVPLDGDTFNLPRENNL